MISLIKRFPLGRALVLLFIISVFAGSVFLNPAEAGQQSKDQFLGEVRSALDKKSVEAFKKLFNWEGVSDTTKATLEKHLFGHLFDNEVETVRFAPLPSDFRTEYVINGVRHYPNVTTLGYVEVKYKKGNHGRVSMKIPYGKKGGRYYFAGTKQETLRKDAPSSKQIQVIIIGFGNPPVTFEGYMLYLENEVPKRKNLKDLGSGNLTQIVRGDDITFLKVKRTSPAGTIQIKILIDDKTIFETQPADTDQPIIFNR